MRRILIVEGCEVFDAVCKCGERVVSLLSEDIEGPEIIIDRKGWVYAMDDQVFSPQPLEAKVVARSRCMECREVGEYEMRFRTGVLASWKKLRGLSSWQDTEKVRPKEFP